MDLGFRVRWLAAGLSSWQGPGGSGVSAALARFCWGLQGFLCSVCKGACSFLDKVQIFFCQFFWVV